MVISYETKRLKLSTIVESNAPQVLDYYTRNSMFLKEWDPKRGEEFYTLSFHEEQLRKELIKIKNGESLRLWLFLKGEEDKIIGMISFNNIVRGVFMSCHLGYSLDESYINQGYITEALKKGIDIIFHNYNLHRIEANIMPRNSRSIRVCEKLGFREEGLAKEYLKINGNWEDHIHMVLLNSEI